MTTYLASTAMIASFCPWSRRRSIVPGRLHPQIGCALPAADFLSLKLIYLKDELGETTSDLDCLEEMVAELVRDSLHILLTSNRIGHQGH